MTPTRKKTVLLAATALMLNFSAAMADNGEPVEPPQATAARADTFKRFDVNQDSNIDLKEATRSATLTHLFESADTDHNGKLSLNEFSQALDNQGR